MTTLDEIMDRLAELGSRVNERPTKPGKVPYGGYVGEVIKITLLGKTLAVTWGLTDLRGESYEVDRYTAPLLPLRVLQRCTALK